jgi:UDP-N-acetylglucosamine 2-epimerase (non-hydrolysing)
MQTPKRGGVRNGKIHVILNRVRREIMHVLHVVGARPNFMKAAPVIHALNERQQVHQSLVHTGQHYDANMSDVFFSQLAMPAPDVNLEVGSGSHARQTAEIMIRFEPVLLERRPDIVLVYGDVNSTVAAALVCSKLLIQVGHVEAGLRSFDPSMPEEINRIVTDRLANFLFTPSQDGDENLQREGVEPKKIYRVGNVMIDSLIRLLPAAMRCPENGLPDRFALVTLHRPSNVDDPRTLKSILDSLLKVSEGLDVIFPVHPRTRQRISEFGLDAAKLHLLDPLPYIEFLALQRRATVVITDSGGIQEETTYLGVPCLTLRGNTERPITVTAGTNTLIGSDNEKLNSEMAKVLEGKAKSGTIPPLWDGHAGERIAEILCRLSVNPNATGTRSTAVV